MTEINWDLSDLTRGHPFRGAIDIMSETHVQGWVIDASNPGTPVDLDIYICGEHALSIVSDIARPDITKVVQSAIQAGFSAEMTDVQAESGRKILRALNEIGAGAIDIRDILRVEVRGTEFTLPLSPVVGTVDCVRLGKSVSTEAQKFPGGEKARIKIRDDFMSEPLGEEKLDVQVVAYYLPQFHPFPENNEWWGEGFTEWTNVTSAKPLFPDHYQPHLPADMGYYDLRLDQVQRDQVSLAKRYGVTGFCYYYYWFSGATLMTMPIDRHLEQDLDLDFCLCWANESWSRRWDGSESDVLMAQKHTYESDVEFIYSCLKYFRSPRYIKIDGAPLLQIYRISLMKNPSETIARWREIVRAEGFPDLHVSMVESFGLDDPARYACDSSCQFPPHGVISAPMNDKVKGLDPRYSGQIYSYAEVIKNEIARPQTAKLQFRAAMPSWDNTSRKGAAGNLFHGSSPALFETWMKYLVTDALNRLPEGQRFVFVNAWNEWAEGTHLEPDRHYGHANLRAVRNALTPASLALAPLSPPNEEGMPDPLAYTRRHVESLTATNKMLTRLITQGGGGIWGADQSVFVAVSNGMIEVEQAHDPKFNIDALNGRAPTMNIDLVVPAARGLKMRGWALNDGRALTLHMVALRGDGGQRYISSIFMPEQRADVAHAFGLGQEAEACGFTLHASLSGVEPGRYELELLTPDGRNPRLAWAIHTNIFLLVG